MTFKTIKTLRSLKTHVRYEASKKLGIIPTCYMCQGKTIKEYQHWKILNNEFPYDQIAKTNHILTTKRHTKEENFNEKEILELKEIKNEIHEKYDMIIENTNKQKSIPQHFHFHLLELKERVIEMQIDQRVDFLQKEKITVAK